MLNAYFSPLFFSRCLYSRRFVAEKRAREKKIFYRTPKGFVLRHPCCGDKRYNRKRSRPDVLNVLKCFSSGAAPYQERESVKEVVLKVPWTHFKDTCDQTISWRGLVVLHSLCVKASWDLRVGLQPLLLSFLRLFSLAEPLHVLANTKGWPPGKSAAWPSL